MALTVQETQVLWSAANSLSIAAGGNGTSDAFTVDATAIQAMAEIKVDNDGVPASGDTVSVWLLPTLGDPDGAGADEYATREQGIHLATLDTNDDDPAITAVTIPLPMTGGKLYAVNNSGGRAQTVSALILEQRSG